MKGLELPMRMIVLVVILVLVLIILSAFFLSQSSGSMTTAKANEIFFSKCDAYKKQQCDWRVTYQKDFNDFYSACKYLNNPDIGKFTCLYKMCCATSEDVKCDGLCELCSGNENLGTTLEQCCEQYKTSCSQSPTKCGICGD